jgi:hypothetical protein
MFRMAVMCHTRKDRLARQRRRPYGFRNFDNYRLRVTVMCVQVSIGGEVAPINGVEPVGPVSY